jgi:hypothetical protein
VEIEKTVCSRSCFKRGCGSRLCFQRAKRRTGEDSKCKRAWVQVRMCLLAVTPFRPKRGTGEDSECRRASLPLVGGDSFQGAKRGNGEDNESVGLLLSRPFNRKEVDK